VERIKSSVDKNVKFGKVNLTKTTISYKMLHSEMENYDEDCKRFKKMFGRNV